MRSLDQMLALPGRLAVVTGAASGIGAATAARLVEQGARVVGLDLAWPPSGTPDAVVALTCDITQAGAIAEAVDHISATHGVIEVWVNNAGSAPRQSLLEMRRDEWDRTLALNLTAAFEGAQAAARCMLGTGRPGVIVNVLSSCIDRVGGNPAHYRAAKAGLKALTQNLAVEVGGHGIRVVGVAPTLTATPQVERLRQQGLSGAFDRFVQRLPLGRLCQADEVATVVSFLVSDLASYVTGSVVYVDGGEAAQ